MDGALIAARIPPSDTAPENARRDQPSDSDIGVTKTVRIATAPPARTKAALMVQPTTTHP